MHTDSFNKISNIVDVSVLCCASAGPSHPAHVKIIITNYNPANACEGLKGTANNRAK